MTEAAAEESAAASGNYVGSVIIVGYRCPHSVAYIAGQAVRAMRRINIVGEHDGLDAAFLEIRPAIIGTVSCIVAGQGHR